MQALQTFLYQMTGAQRPAPSGILHIERRLKPSGQARNIELIRDYSFAGMAGEESIKSAGGAAQLIIGEDGGQKADGG